MRETCAYSQTDSALIKLAIAHTGHTHNNDSALEDPVVAELFLQSLDCRQTLPAVALLDAHVHIILCSGASTRVLSICLGNGSITIRHDPRPSDARRIACISNSLFSNTLQEAGTCYAKPQYWHHHVLRSRHTKGGWKLDVEIRHETWLLRFCWHRADHAFDLLFLCRSCQNHIISHMLHRPEIFEKHAETSTDR